MVIVESKVPGENVGRIIEKLETALDGEPRGHALVALISMALFAMNPELTPDELQNGVREISKFICLTIEGHQSHQAHVVIKENEFLAPENLKKMN